MFPTKELYFFVLCCSILCKITYYTITFAQLRKSKCKIYSPSLFHSRHVYPYPAPGIRKDRPEKASFYATFRPVINITCAPVAEISNASSYLHIRSFLLFCNTSIPQYLPMPIRSEPTTRCQSHLLPVLPTIHMPELRGFPMKKL